MKHFFFKFSLLRTSFLLLFCGMYLPAMAKTILKPCRLTCEYQHDPTVIDAQSPRLSWTNYLSEESVRGEKQKAWQLVVASSATNLFDEKYDVWDSGKVEEESTPYVKYQGKVLESTKTYWWRVRVWNQKGEVSEWSRPGYWTMGLLQQSDWKGSWIGAPWDGEDAREYVAGYPSYPAPLLKKDFRTRKKVVSAQLFASGIGYFELYMNGKRVGNAQLSPNQTNYGKRPELAKRGIPVEDQFTNYRVMYVGYDVLGLLNQKGANTIGCILGNGFANSMIHWVAAYCTPRFIGQLMLEYEDGTTEIIASGEDWQVHESAIRLDDVYSGEFYDARCEIKDWCSPKCSTGNWDFAVEKQAPYGELVAQNGPADRIMERLKPLSIVRKGTNCYEVDFGEEISGWLRLNNIRGKRGDTITVRYLSESPNGISQYVLKGEGVESYATRFTWFVFRKVKIENWQGDLTPKHLTAEAVYSDVAQSGRFLCSNELFNTINKIWLRSQRDNMHGSIASDCPHRERSAYTGDGQVSCVTVMHNLNAASFYNKWIKDIRDAQNKETGYVPNAAPWQPGCGGGVAWGAAMSIMPWEFYTHYGDEQLLRENYPAMKFHLEYMRRWKTPEGTMYSEAPDRTNKMYWMNLGEWCFPFEMPLDELVHTFYWWRCTEMTAKAAKVLGFDSDATQLMDEALEIKNAFVKKFYNQETGSFGLGGANIFALKMGLSNEIRKRATQALKEEIKAHDNHLVTGIFGTQFLFEVLAENGENELAYEIMNQRDYPSYGYWIAQGATTTWERWDGRDSRNHPMFGGGLTWFYRVLAGVKADENRPGFKHFFVSPLIPKDLDSVSYSLDTKYGEVKSSWKKERNGLSIELKVPEGTSATFELPEAYENYKLLEKNKPFVRSKGVRMQKTVEGKKRLYLQSGTYKLQVVSE